MADLGTLIPAIGASGVLGWAGNAALRWIQSREERKQQATNADVALEQHRDKLTLDLLETARTEAKSLREEIAAARAEAAISRSLQNRLAHFEEALDHIGNLLSTGTPEEKKASERRATAFLNRMRRLAEAEGTLRNELQIHESEKLMNDIGPILPPREKDEDA